MNKLIIYVDAIMYFNAHIVRAVYEIVLAMLKKIYVFVRIFFFLTTIYLKNPNRQKKEFSNCPWPIPDCDHVPRACKNWGEIVNKKRNYTYTLFTWWYFVNLFFYFFFHSNHFSPIVSEKRDNGIFLLFKKKKNTCIMIKKRLHFIIFKCV